MWKSEGTVTLNPLAWNGWNGKNSNNAKGYKWLH